MRIIITTLFSTLLLFSCCKTKQPLVGSWIEIMPANPQIIQGVTLNSDGSATSIGMATLVYEKWGNPEPNKIILWGKSIGNGQTINFSDTLNIIKVTTDSLTLGRSGMYQISYTREKDPS